MSCSSLTADSSAKVGVISAVNGEIKKGAWTGKEHGGSHSQKGLYQSRQPQVVVYFTKSCKKSSWSVQEAKEPMSIWPRTVPSVSVKRAVL
jgi:hypothetical protein